MKLTSSQHPLVKHFVKLRNDSDYRNEHHSFVLEGLKPLQEVKQPIKKLIYSASIGQLPLFNSPQIIEVTDEIIKKISGMKSSEGILAEVEMPSFGNYENWNYILVLDGINDPGNMGTLFRTALALGWDGVFLLPNCCDPYNEKVVRAARGAHFKLQLAKGTIKDLERLHKKDYQMLVGDIMGAPPNAIQDSPKRLLVLGNEAVGPSPEITKLCLPLSIPMKGEMESLNVAVAGGILLYLMGKR